MNLLQTLATQFVSRATAQDMKGKSRDQKAIEFFCGAIGALDASAQNDNARWIERVTAILICTRGYSEVQRIAKQGADFDSAREYIKDHAREYWAECLKANTAWTPDYIALIVKQLKGEN